MNRKTVDKARATRDKIGDAIYALAPDGQTKFWDCYKLADKSLQDAFHEADRALDAAQDEAVARGRAWRGAYGLLCWNR